MLVICSFIQIYPDFFFFFFFLDSPASLIMSGFFRPATFMPFTPTLGVVYLIWIMITNQTLQFGFHPTSIVLDEMHSNRTLITNTNDVHADDVDGDGSDELHFVTKLVNAKTGETHTCSPHRFKYLHLIHESLKQHRNGTKKLHSSDLNKIGRGKAVRIRIIDGTLYVISGKPSSDGGQFMFLSYFQRLLLKYGKYVPDTDFVFGWSDGSVYKSESNAWFHKNQPFFMSEGVSPGEAQNVYPLYLLSRGWLVSEHTRYESWLSECLNRNNVNQYTAWEDKINMIEFRGAHNGNARLPLISKIIDKYGINNATNGYNVALTSKINNQKYLASGLNVTSEIKYKHRLVLDGISVRDGWHKQSLQGGLIYKDRSINKEWWYYNLVDNDTVLYYDNAAHLMQLTDDNIHTVREWEEHRNVLYKDKYMHLKNMTVKYYKWYKANLWNTINVDCFVIHMIQVYNQYLLDTSTINNNGSMKGEKYCFSSECPRFSTKHYNHEVQGSYTCPFDNVTSRFCQFC
eukprot:856723_1